MEIEKNKTEEPLPLDMTHVLNDSWSECTVVILINATKQF